MNFVCDRCKQKYHVADEKLRGRAVTRFRCKKCEHVIELDLAASDAAAKPAAEPATVSAPTVPRPAIARPKPAGTAPIARPRAATMVGGTSPLAAKAPARPRAATVTGVAVGAAAKPALRAPERSASAILNASETGWYAGIRDLPVGPLTRKELLDKVQAGDVTADTLVWREGLDDWRPLRHVAELGDMLRVGAQKLAGNHLDELGKRPAPSKGAQVVSINAARTGSLRPPPRDEDDEATRVTGLDPAIAAMAAKALAKPRAVEPDTSGEDATLVNARGAVVAPVAPASISSRPPAALSEDDLAAGPTLDTSHAAPPAPAPVEAARAPSSAPPPAGDFGDELPEDLFAKPKAPVREASAVTTLSFGSDLAAPALTSATPSAPAATGGPLLSPVSAPPAPMPAPMPAPAYSAPPPSTVVAGQRPGGLSVAVVVLIGGVLVAGVGLGIYIGQRRAPAPAPAPAPVATRTAPAPVPAPSVADPVALNPSAPAQPEAAPAQPEAAPTQPEAAPTQPEAAPTQTGSGHSASRSHGSSHSRSSAQEPTLTAAQRAALRDLGAQPAASAGGPVGNTQLRTTPAVSPSNNSGETASARANRAIRIFQDSRVAHNCWQSVLRQNPALRSAAVTISFTVSSQGRFINLEVNNSPDARFTQCIRSRSGGIAPLGGGSVVNAQVSVNLTAS